MPLLSTTVFFAAGAAELDLERHAHLGHALEILPAGRDVVLEALLAEVQHVR
jgi:hypothetical protein